MRRRREDASSLELLLDTMCNTFGGVMFIAISLVVVISMVRSASRALEENAPRKLEQLQQDLADLQQNPSTPPTPPTPPTPGGEGGEGGSGEGGGESGGTNPAASGTSGEGTTA